MLVASISTGSHGAGFYALVLGEFTRVALDEIVLDDPPIGAVELFERLGNPLEALGPIEPRAEIRRRRPLLLGEPTGQSFLATSLPTGLLGLDPGDRANPVYEWLAGPRLEFGQLAGDDHQRDLNEIVGVGLGESPAKVGAELEGELPTQLVPRSRFAVSHGEHQTVEVHPASIPKSDRRDLSQRPTPKERTRGHPRCSLERLTVSASDPPDDELDELDHPPPPRLLPPDLSELFGAIGDATSLRKVWNPDEPPFVFDRFEAFECFIGGMGLVIEARDPELDRKVAIKLWEQSGPKAQQALLDEAKTLARLSHRNVVTVHETGRWRERVFFVMEWIDGVDGQAWMKTPRTWREVRDVFVEAGQGLAAAHDAGIQHRDFKPANMLIGSDRRVVVADFGIADSLREVDNADPRWGTPAGTPAYMAPERLRGGRGDARSDQFSFCVAMWRGLYGVRPYAGEQAEELLESIGRGELRMTPDADVPRWLTEVVRKGLAEDPDARHGSMHELVAALRDEPPDDVVLDGSASEAARRGQGWPYYAIALLSGTVVVMGIMLMRRPSDTPAVSDAVEVEPFHAILGLVALDEFSKVEALWSNAELTDEQSLTLASACLGRAEELMLVDRAKAIEGASTAHKIAAFVRQFGATPEFQIAGDQLVTDIEDLSKSIARTRGDK